MEHAAPNASAWGCKGGGWREQTVQAAKDKEIRVGVHSSLEWLCIIQAIPALHACLHYQDTPLH